MGVMEPRDRWMILTHYYRAMVGRADVWRMRMDATTNWAIGATAAVVSFALGDESTPHYVVFIATILTFSFLLLEARRLTFYHLWQQRVLLLEGTMIRWAAGPEHAPAEDEELALEGLLGDHLGRTVPSMSLGRAAARRLRRIYLYLFAVQLLAWALKLSSHPTSSTSLHDITKRAAIASASGGWVLAIAGLGFLALLIVAAARGGVGSRTD